MGTNTILANREEVREIEAEEQYRFTASILSELGLPEERMAECFPEEGEFTVQHKIKLRKLCQDFKISIVDDKDSGIKIYVEDTLVAEWFKPWFVLRTDMSEPIPENRLYVEIQTKWWSIFEENDGKS